MSNVTLTLVHMSDRYSQDAKNNCDQIERELQRTEEVIKGMFNDVQVLRDNRYNQANELHRRYGSIKHSTFWFYFFP